MERSLKKEKKERRKKDHLKNIFLKNLFMLNLYAGIKRHKWLYLLIFPGFIYFIIFKYVPMLGAIIAFQQFSPVTGFLKSPFVGLYHFKNLFIGPDFLRLLTNTLGISILSLVFFFPAPIILALLLNEIRSKVFERISQTLIYVPHFISYVIVATLSYQLLNINDGAINILIQSVFGKTVDVLAGPQYFKGLIVGQNIWKETGYGTIIFLAALSGVDMELYEAAKVDGAGRMRLMWHVTLPAIRGTIVIMLILKVGSVLNTGYEQIFLMQNSLNIRAADVFDTYVYTRGIKQGQYSYATAVGLFKTVVSMILVLGSNKLAKKCGESGFY